MAESIRDFQEILVAVIEEKSVDLDRVNSINIESEETNRSSYYGKFYHYVKYYAGMEKQDLLAFFKAINRNTEFESDLVELKSRQRRIFMKKWILDFRVIDWDDDSNLREIELFFYRRALFDYEQIVREEGVKTKKLDNSRIKPMQITTIRPTMHNDLKMRNKPSMTLDEYVEYVDKTNAETIRKRVERNNRKSIEYTLYHRTERDAGNKEYERKREKDEERDEYKANHGNLYKQG